MIGFDAQVEDSLMPVVVPCPWCSDRECGNLEQSKHNLVGAIEYFN